MKITLDLNVVLDVVQNRAPYYQDSAEVLSRARTGEFAVVLPSHAVTTLYPENRCWISRQDAKTPSRSPWTALRRSESVQAESLWP